MIQVENEIRNLRPLARAGRLTRGKCRRTDGLLQRRKDTLVPELRQVWEAAGSKDIRDLGGGVRAERHTGEILQGWNFCALRRPGGRGGQSRIPDPDVREQPRSDSGKANARPVVRGAPMPDLIDIWQAGAPKIDMLSAGHLRPRLPADVRAIHPLREPAVHSETRGFPPNNLAARVLYAFGRHDAIGYLAHGIERPPAPDIELTSAYDVIRQLAPLDFGSRRTECRVVQTSERDRTRGLLSGDAESGAQLPDHVVGAGQPIVGSRGLSIPWARKPNRIMASEGVENPGRQVVRRESPRLRE